MRFPLCPHANLRSLRISLLQSSSIAPLILRFADALMYSYRFMQVGAQLVEFPLQLIVLLEGRG